MGFKSGFVAFIGKPNVGKSTLLNSIMQKKVAIATPKPQTTRDNIRGILTLEDAQIIFVDTPGIHKGRQKLNQMMVQHAYEAVKDVDIICMLIDAEKGIEKSDEIIMDSIAKVQKPKILVINKIDKLQKSDLIELLMKCEGCSFDEIVPLSALKGRNTDELVEVIKSYLNEDLQYYPSDMISDYPESFMYGEIIREKVLLNTSEEVPHSIAVTIENIEDKGDVMVINALITCERDSQKKIIVGHRGDMIKKISTFARMELEERTGKRIYLEVFVNVEENWRNKAYQLAQFGYLNKEDE